ncbi:MAG: transketolase C-terminal domain-containing protein [Patescibacteria group bacterium]
MRTAFVEEITKLAREDKNLWLLTGDLGFSVFDNFQKEFPAQYLNVGVAEQNLISIAAGLAMSGKKVFVYSISTFLTMRPLEQIRNDLCYQNLPVYLIGGGSTFSYSMFGCTHFPLEDLGLMRLLPNMAVMAPGDPLEVRALIRDVYRRNSPAYIRIAKKGEPVIHASDDVISLGRASKIRDGKDISILVSGRQLANALSAVTTLKKNNINCHLLSFHTIKPLDKLAIIKAAKETKGIVVVEEHFKNGGLGMAVAEILAQEGLSIPLINIGIDDEFPKGSGSQDYFLKKYGLSPEGIIKAVNKILHHE